MGKQSVLPGFDVKIILRFLTVAFASSAILSLFISTPVIFCDDRIPAQSQIEKEMTLSDCVFLAVRNNRSIKSAYLDRVVQKFNLQVAADAFIPNLTVTPSVQHSSTGDGDNRYHTNKDSLNENICKTSQGLRKRFVLI